MGLRLLVRMRESVRLSEREQEEMTQVPTVAQEDLDDLCLKLALIQGGIHLLILVVYSVLGGCLFWGIEKEHGDVEVIRYRERCKDEEVQGLASLEQECKEKSYQDCKQQIVNVLARVESCHLDWLHNPPTLPMSHWLNSLVYSFSAYTTIGYGNISTETTLGRVVCMFYVVVGLPLFFNVQREGVNLLRRLNVWVADGLGCFSGGPDFATLSRTEQKLAFLRRIAPLSILSALVYILVVSGVLGAVFQWQYVHVIYFVFQSVTLVGFGDVFPSDPYEIGLAALLIAPGIFLVSLAILPVQEEIHALVARIVAHVPHEKKPPTTTSLSNSQ